MYYFLLCFSVKSYIKAKKDKKLSTKEIIDEIRKEKKENGVTKVVAKNVVVSSFTAPAPVAPVVVSPSSTETSDGVTPSLLDDDVIDDVFLFNNLSPAEETTDDTASSMSSLDDTLTAEETKGNYDDVPESVPMTPSTDTDDALHMEETDVALDMTASRIPRRIGSIRKQSDSSKENAIPTTEGRQKTTSTSEFNGSSRKFSAKDRHASSESSSIPTRAVVTAECEQKTPAPFPKTFRGSTSKRALEFNSKSTSEKKPNAVDSQAESTEPNTKTDADKSSTSTASKISSSKSVVIPENSIARLRSIPAVSRKPVVTSSVSLPRKSSGQTPQMPRKNEGSLHKLQSARSSSVKEITTDDNLQGKIVYYVVIYPNPKVVGSCPTPVEVFRLRLLTFTWRNSHL